MTAQMAIILKQYDEHNMSIQDIVEENGGELDTASVKCVLAQYSSKYRSALKEEGGSSEDFTLDEAEAARQAIVQIMQSTDDDFLKLRAAKYIRDDKKGRLDIGLGIKNINLDVIVFNETLKKVSEARNRTKSLNKNNAIEVEATASSVK